ncbi:MAG: sec-independent translocase [Nocardioidaceae bacterium]
MFGVGLPEMAVLFVIALVVFGPDKLPEFARQAGRLVRQLRTLSQNARDEIRSELGPEYADFELTDLDPRRVVRKHLQEAWDDADLEQPAKPTAPSTPLGTGERPPFDPDAT